jgi:hypothetical protein
VWEGRIGQEDSRTLLEQQQADVTLIAACQQGDPRAYRHVYELYKDRIYGLCRNMSGNDEDASDLTQDVFISAFKNIQSFPDGGGVWHLALPYCRKPMFEGTPSVPA